MSAISIENLTRDYGRGKGVFGLSLEVRDGEAFGFLGPNGAGKTTTIRHLMGFLKPESGRCTIGGLDCWKNNARVQERLGYIPGEISFFDDMAGTEFLKFLSNYRKVRSDSRTKELLERFRWSGDTARFYGILSVRNASACIPNGVHHHSRQRAYCEIR